MKLMRDRLQFSDQFNILVRLAGYRIPTDSAVTSIVASIATIRETMANTKMSSHSPLPGFHSEAGCSVKTWLGLPEAITGSMCSLFLFEGFQVRELSIVCSVPSWEVRFAKCVDCSRWVGFISISLLTKLRRRSAPWHEWKTCGGCNLHTVTHFTEQMKNIFRNYI